MAMDNSPESDRSIGHWTPQHVVASEIPPPPLVRVWFVVACRDGISCVEFVVADWCLVDTRVQFGTRVLMVRMDMELRIPEVKRGCTCEVCKSCYVCVVFRKNGQAPC
jgi:hypothetical protein